MNGEQGRTPVVWRSNPGTFAELKAGHRRFDVRRWDRGDWRCTDLLLGNVSIDRLSGWGQQGPAIETLIELGIWKPLVPVVHFEHTETQTRIAFEYRGVLFPAYMPGYGVILLGKRIVDKGEPTQPLLAAGEAS